MALRPDRSEPRSLIHFVMNATGEAGSLVVFDVGNPSGVGSILDDANSKVKLPVNTDGSGEKPAGILLGDVVNKDLSKTHLDAHRRESQIGGKVAIAREGEFLTNRLASGLVPKAGDPAYYTAQGVFKTTDPNSVSTKVGTFLSGKDSKGYALIAINIV